MNKTTHTRTSTIRIVLLVFVICNIIILLARVGLLISPDIAYARIEDVSVSSDGRLVALLYDGGKLIISDRLSGNGPGPIVPLGNHTSRVACAKFAPKSERIVIIDGERMSILWQDSRAIAQVLDDPPRLATHVEWSADEANIIIGCATGQVHLWRLGENACELVFPGLDGTITCMCCCEQAVYWGTEEGKIIELNVSTQEFRTVAEWNGGPILDLTSCNQEICIVAWESKINSNSWIFWQIKLDPDKANVNLDGENRPGRNICVAMFCCRDGILITGDANGNIREQTKELESDRVWASSFVGRFTKLALVRK